jgi:carboxypeptidase C (cathepsin A)
MRPSRRAFVRGAAAGAASLGLVRGGVARAADPPNPAALARSVVTHGSVTLAAGTSLAYTATASTIVLRDEHDAPAANVFSTAYTAGDASRPVTFCSNGGPGSASIWLHIGAFGPQRIVTSNATFTPPAPYRIDENPWTLLDATDLVFVDPVGTGYSTLAGNGSTRDFWGVDEDLRAFSQFVRRWLATNGRTTSPIFLLGESYGTLRSAGLADRLQKDGVAVNGVILMSTVLDYADDFGDDDDERVAAFAIPSEAAVAWYHRAVPNPAPDVATAVARARAFTSDVYLPAILRPTPPDDDERTRLANQLHELIGLDPAFIERAHLRVSKERFESELLRDRGRVIGRYDGRFAGVAIDRNGNSPDYDPSYEAIAPAFTAVFTAYASNVLKWESDRLYRVLPGDVGDNWNFKRGGFLGRVLAPSVIGDLREAMHTNPSLRVFSANGWYDLATPFFGTEEELGRVGLDPSVAQRISFGYYPSGHMIYLSDDALRALHADLAAFYRTTLDRSAAGLQASDWTQPKSPGLEHARDRHALGPRRTLWV